MQYAVSPTVARVTRGELCAGCGLCASVSRGAIHMESAEPGYARPVQTGAVSGEMERTIAESCPGAVVAPWAKAPKRHHYWGPWRRVFTGYATAPDVRFESSSGGAISALLAYALTSGLVDRVVHVGVAAADPTCNDTVVSRTLEEVVARAGSRYTASSPLERIDEELAAGGTFAFVGKPCDVSALRQLARRDPRVAAHVPIVISFFCGGIPSHAGVGRILRAMGVAAASVREFRFRGRGWPGNCVAVTDTRTAEMTYAESWGAHLSREVQFRCKICPDSVGGVADIACADAWYGDEEGYPLFSEAEGRSLVVSRSEAGDRLLDAAVGAGVLEVEPCVIDDIERMQPGQARRKRAVLFRVAAVAAILQPRPRMRGLEVARAARNAPFREIMTNFGGTIRRIFEGRGSRL